LNALAPGVEAQGFTLLDARTPEDAHELASTVAAYDLVVTHLLPGEKYGPMGTKELKATGRPVVVVPRMAFTGFHPDSVLLADSNAGRLGSYHSAIAAGAHVAGVPRERVAALFNAYVFSRLGFREEYAKSKAFMLAQMNRCDIGGEDIFGRWERLGAFMYTPNHPFIEVLQEIAIDLCEHIGVSFSRHGALPADVLARNIRLPIYPEIARWLGVDGGSDVLLATGEALSLEQTAAEIYRSYNRRGVDLSRDPRVAMAADLFRTEVDCLAA
jgi:hypothetical protein